jgi:hypothetical protein
MYVKIVLSEMNLSFSRCYSYNAYASNPSFDGVRSAAVCGLQYVTFASSHRSHKATACLNAFCVAEAAVSAPQARRGTQSVVAALPAQDIAFMQTMQAFPVGPAKPVRSEHKFQKKPQKQKGPNPRTSARAGVSPYGGFEDIGSGLSAYVQVGRKGGIVR